MNLRLHINKFALTAFILSLAFLGIYSFKFYESNSQKNSEILEEIAEEQGSVAGIKTKNELSDLTNLIPIFPNSEISGFNKSNNQVFMTLETNADDNQIKSFYDDYFLKNNWEKKELNIYIKEGKTIKVDFSNGIINITYAI